VRRDARRARGGGPPLELVVAVYNINGGQNAEMASRSKTLAQYMAFAEVEPYFIQFIWSSWYVFGWCRLRGDFRQFKLNRLWNLSLADERFQLRDVPPEQLGGGYASPEPHNVKILFDKSVRFRLIEEYGLNCYEETADALLLSLDYSNKDYVFSWILGFGDKAKLLAPEETRSEVAALARNIFFFVPLNMTYGCRVRCDRMNKTVLIGER
jgi:hypothetical protein